MPNAAAGIVQATTVPRRSNKRIKHPTEPATTLGRASPTNNALRFSTGQRYVFRPLSTDKRSLLFVDWKTTGVKGFARPEDCVVNEFPSLSSAKKTTSTNLWCGAAPKSIDTQFIAEVDADPDDANKSIRIPYKDVKPVQNRIRVGVPTSVDSPDVSNVTVVDVSFHSHVVKLDVAQETSLSEEAYLYRMVWQDKSSDKTKPHHQIHFRLPPEMFSSKRTKMVAMKTAPERLILHSPTGRGEPKGIAFLSPLAPARRKLTVQFFDQNGNEAATGAVVVYLPASAD